MRRRLLRSARARLTVVYSVSVFALAALVLGGLYWGVARRLKPVPTTVPLVYKVTHQAGLPYKRVVIFSTTSDPTGEARNAEKRATLRRLQELTFEALAALFLASLGIGWVVAGRVLRPVGRITAAARRIQATNLSERIALDGPQDELKTLADTFDEMLARLDASFTAQRQFVADASHELRNPLAVIQTNADVALWDGEIPESARARLEAVRRASERMRRLVDDLLALARLELTTAERSEVDLAALVHELGGELDSLARAHELTIEQDAESGLRVVADRDALKRALANLLDNAFRHSPPGAPVRVAAARRNGFAVLSVADRGPGLTADEQEHVFERFWRSDSARSRQSGGVGLGLAIVRRIAESHGGAVAVDSRPGDGSTFEIRLPVQS
ncbi:MAG TPA: HAMP domain-containing sensor histidine kinase [Gaiellaceae bacterium]|nr:HAMP domain-containing sensor histidine kinase [Gaiellaceae bacterium]